VALRPPVRETRIVFLVNMAQTPMK
jgi:hypothetical protein